MKISRQEFKDVLLLSILFGLITAFLFLHAHPIVGPIMYSFIYNYNAKLQTLSLVIIVMGTTALLGMLIMKLIKLDSFHFA